MSDRPTTEENGVLLSFIKRYLGERLSRDESNHACVAAAQNYKRILAFVREEQEILALLRLRPVTEVAGMVFTAGELELLRNAKRDGRSITDIFSSPPFIADGIRATEKA